MSLYKQLWLAIAFLMLSAFVGSFYVSNLSASNYLQEQLAIKNSDNATALASSLAKWGSDTDLLKMEMDSWATQGFYQSIVFENANGELIFDYRSEDTELDAPTWLVALFPIAADPGIAHVMSVEWINVGTVTLASHSRFAYGELWKGSKRLMGYFLGAAIFAGVIGSYLLRLITSPLGAVVVQAQAIGERRFVTTPEPTTLEFKAVVSSMNTLSGRIKEMLEAEAARLEQWRKDAQLDQVTKLLNRGPFIGNLSAVLDRNDTVSSGVLMMIRLPSLIELNRSEGRAVVDSLLKRFGETLNEYPKQNKQWSAGRLNGSDFVLMAPGEDDAENLARSVQKALLSIVTELNISAVDNLPAASTEFASGESIGDILTRLDTNLLAAEKEGNSTLKIALRSGGTSNEQKVDQSGHWRKILSNAFANETVGLAYFTVTNMAGELIHEECPARLQVDGEWLNAGIFLPWVNRLNFTTELDKAAIKKALADLETHPNTLCVNVSTTALEDDDFQEWIADTLRQRPNEAARLWLEVPEYGVYQHLEAFRRMCKALKPLNTRIGIEHVGHEISQIGQLHDLGLDYVKVDASLVRNIHDNQANQTLVRALAMIVHSIGLIAIAEMVQSDDEWQALKGLGIDGATGPEAGRKQVK